MNYIDKQLGIGKNSYNRVASVPLDPLEKDYRHSVNKINQELNSYYKTGNRKKD